VSDDRESPLTKDEVEEFTVASQRAGQDFSALRELLVGDERRGLEDLSRRLEALETPEELAKILPDAVALRSAKDRQLARALAPTIEEAIDESVHSNPQRIAQAIFPILGPAIRKAIAETMAGFVNTLNKAIEHSLSLRGLKWRFEAWRTGVPYAQIVIKHALVYRVEQVFLIHAETGLLLAHVTHGDLDMEDADLVSGMLTAIRDFVNDSFDAGSEAGLRTFAVGELTVIVEAGPNAQLAAVVRGQYPPDLLERLQGTLETVHLQFGSALRSFEGDAAPFDEATPLMESCLDTVLTTDRPTTRGATLRIAWVIIIVALLALAILVFRSNRRWNRAVRLIENEPGIILVDADRSIRRWHFRGLRDPLAAAPLPLLAQLGVDSTRVDAEWEPYLSFDSAIVLDRARQILSPPASIQFDLAHDVLVASGAAPGDWLENATMLASRIPGVTRLDASAVNASIPAELADLASHIERLRVLFDIGSASLSPAGRRSVAQVADSFRLLRSIAADAGYQARLGIIGRTDTTGSNETNQVLSQQRAQSVLAALTGMEVPQGEMAAAGVGTTDPISADDPEARARVNRSVTFGVTLVPDTADAGRSQ
jgi:OOP family OmpA-OmpF porin